MYYSLYNPGGKSNLKMSIRAQLKIQIWKPIIKRQEEVKRKNYVRFVPSVQHLQNER